MSNYVWNRVICNRNTLNMYFIDPEPFGDGRIMEPPYISFNRLFQVKSLNACEEKHEINISYSWGVSWFERPDSLIEIKFATRWKYPINAILKTLNLEHDTIWYAVEENHIFASKFIWQNGVREYVTLLGKEYFDWDDVNEDFVKNLDDSDDGAWYYLDCIAPDWMEWPSSDDFKRYSDGNAYKVLCSFF